jgi:hypothetical protein
VNRRSRKRMGGSSFDHVLARHCGDIVDPAACCRGRSLLK